MTETEWGGGNSYCHTQVDIAESNFASFWSSFASPSQKKSKGVFAGEQKENIVSGEISISWSQTKMGSFRL